MQTYVVRRVSERADVACIAHYPWSAEYCPRAEARVSWDESGLYIAMTAWERTVSALETRTGGGVYVDSCMEFFLQPCPDADARYLNCEVNALGVMHLGVGEGRHGRGVYRTLPDGVAPKARVLQGEKWDVRYTLPSAFIQGIFPGWTPKPGAAMRGNFYKCDESIHPHFGCWNEILSPAPDFHRPECFGRLVLA